jgi:3-oxoacyl-[acyl-carrier protein] reductase
MNQEQEPQPFTPAAFRLDGQVAVVAGGSRGIGRAIALGLAQAGADVVVASRRIEACTAVAGEIEALGRRALAVACDTSKQDEVAPLLDRSERELGPCGVAVYSAGLSEVGAAKDASRDALQRMVEVHYLGAVELAQRAAAQMRARGGGSILFVTSVWGLGGHPSQLAYGGAKAAMAHAARVLAIEWARDGIRVNAIAPGLVETDMTKDLPDDARDKLVRRIPLRRAARPDEMAGPAVFLCSPAASYVTGQILAADGGERAR